MQQVSRRLSPTLGRDYTPLRSIAHSEEETHDQKAEVDVVKDDVEESDSTEPELLGFHGGGEDDLGGRRGK